VTISCVVVSWMHSALLSLLYSSAGVYSTHNLIAQAKCPSRAYKPAVVTLPIRPTSPIRRTSTSGSARHHKTKLELFGTLLLALDPTRGPTLALLWL
jgi:hypothetical protein